MTEIVQAVPPARQQEVRGAQAEDGERVRREHDERLVADTASTAGTESTAKITSVNSTTTSAASSGVAARLAFCFVKK